MDLPPIPTGTDILVNTTTANYQDYSAIAALAGGGFVVVWASNIQDVSGWGLYGQIFDVNGSVVGGEFRCNATISTDQSYPTVTALQSGGFVVSWGSSYPFFAPSYTTTYWDVYAQPFNATGVPQGAELHVTSIVEGTENYSSAAGLSDGTFVIAWSDDNLQVHAQRYSSNGTVLGAENLVASNLDYTLSASVVALSNASYLITWTAYNSDGSGPRIYGQRCAADGTHLGAQFSFFNTTVALFGSDVVS